MSTPSPTSPPKRPRLSLQIKAIANGPTGRTSRTLAAAVDVKSPTAFNTLSNVYAAAVDRSTPVRDKPPANVLTSGGRPTLRLQTQAVLNAGNEKSRSAHTPYLGPYLDTPLTAQPISPAVTAVAAQDVQFPSSMTMTATPPMSAVENKSQNFEAAAQSTSKTPITPGGMSNRRRTTMPATLHKLPYTHPRSLRSILRNSPLPPLTTTKSPISPRRQSARLQEKAARRVAYNSPLCQTITTSKYTKSHVDLLTEDDTTPTTPSVSDDDLLDQAMACETRDGGQTPGPFEEMRRRMAGLHASTPAALSPTSAGGIRKRGGKRKEKKRRWVWTIGKEGDDDEEGSPLGAAIAGSGVTPVGETTQPTSVPASAPLSIPVIAVPAPRPRTRMQVAMATASGGQQVPIVAVPVPPKKKQVPIVQVTVPEPTPQVVRDATTPEPITAVLAPEPPTPSLSVASSNADPVFEPVGAGDVEMSDASSLYSDSEAGDETPHYHNKPAGLREEDMDMMDTDATPVATRPAAVVFKEANRGWAPWVS